MNKYFLLAVLSLIISIACLGASVASGEGAVHIFLIFPVISVNSIFSGLGALFLIMTFIFVFLGFVTGFEPVSLEELQSEMRGGDVRTPQQSSPPPAQGSKRINVQGGGVVLVGPIPIIFGSNQKLTLILVIISLIIMVLAIVFFMPLLI